MSSKNNKPLKNAEEIIERFGGIRPMSSKTDIPVTTIQGWKKRGTIPAKRSSEIIKAADENNIEISDLLDNTALKGKVQSRASVPTSSKSKTINKVPVDKKVSEDKDDTVLLSEREEDVVSKPVDVNYSKTQSQNNSQSRTLDKATLQKEIKEMESRAVQKSVLISIVIVCIVLAAITALLWPKAKDMNERIDANDQALAEIQDEDSGWGISMKATDLLPESWQNQINGLTQQAEDMKKQAVDMKAQADAALLKAEEISNDVLGKDGGNLEQRVAKLEAHLGDVMETPQMTYFMEKLQGWGASVPGQETLESAQGQLNSLLSSYTGAPEQLEGYLNQAREQSAVLGQTFEGVPGDEMKAAALLFTLNQMRGALNRDDQPFGDDLELFRNFIGVEDTALNEALDKLAPSAESGVLTVSGLSDEFRDLAGDVVVSSLQGEDVSIQERTKARMNELFSVKRDGELVSGTDTQAKVARIDRLLAEENLDAAIEEAKTLSGPEGETVAPWIEKAEQTKAAQDVLNIVNHNIDVRTNDEASSKLNIPETPMAGRMIVDPKSGLQIYTPATTGFKSP